MAIKLVQIKFSNSYLFFTGIQACRRRRGYNYRRIEGPYAEEGTPLIEMEGFVQLERVWTRKKEEPSNSFLFLFLKNQEC